MRHPSPFGFDPAADGGVGKPLSDGLAVPDAQSRSLEARLTRILAAADLAAAIGLKRAPRSFRRERLSCDSRLIARNGLAS
jgi:hypothetical protein